MAYTIRFDLKENKGLPQDVPYLVTCGTAEAIRETPEGGSRFDASIIKVLGFLKQKRSRGCPGSPETLPLRTLDHITPQGYFMLTYLMNVALMAALAGGVALVRHVIKEKREDTSDEDVNQ